MGGSTVGLIASLIQTIERINFALQPKIPLSCDLSAIFSCSNVFDAWQSRVFGFSNSLVCMIFFAITLGVAMAGLTGSRISRIVRLGCQGSALFFLGFGAWYLWQSTFRIGFICIFCLFCYAAVIIMNWAWFRLNIQEFPPKIISSEKLQKFIEQGGDVAFAIMWAMAIVAMLIIRFA